MERIENIGFGNLQLIQNPDYFCYGVDAVILADFAHSICPNAQYIVDMGTGTGIIPIILSHKNKNALITGVEVQESSAKMAARSCQLNSLEKRISIITGDVSDSNVYSSLKADVVVCNPPYFTKGGAIPNNKKEKFIARHETTAVFEDFVKTAASILKGKGDFFIVHRPSRLVDIFYYCRKHKLEPKTMRMVAPKAGEAPNIVLIHCSAGGGKELKNLSTLYVYNSDGTYTEDIERIYERK